MLTEDVPDHDPESDVHGFTNGPIDGEVLMDHVEQLTGDDPQAFITEDLDSTVIGLEGIIESDLIIGEVQLFSTFLGLTHLLGKLDMLRDDLSRSDGEILILADGLLDQGGKEA